MARCINYTMYGRSVSSNSDEDERAQINSDYEYRSKESPSVSKFGGSFGDLLKEAAEKKKKKTR